MAPRASIADPVGLRRRPEGVVLSAEASQDAAHQEAKTQPATAADPKAKQREIQAAFFKTPQKDLGYRLSTAWLAAAAGRSNGKRE